MVRIFVEFAFIFNLVPRIWTHNTTENLPTREHKVHNIVLYPDKHSWCKATPIVQVIGHPGCKAVKTENNVCVGACFSYIVPRTVPETPGDVSPYCDSCQPGHVTWKKVTLECNEGTFKNQNLTKHVEYIHDCNCGSCKDLRLWRGQSEEEVSLEDNSLEDISINEYSLNSTSERNQMSPNSSQSNFKNAISRMLLKTLSHEDESVLENAESKGLHRNVWKNLLEKVETSNNSLDASNFNEIIKSVENELKVTFNYKRLKQVLLKLKKFDNDAKLSNLFNKTLDPIANSSLTTSNEETQSLPQSTAGNLRLLKTINNGSETSHQGNIEKLVTLDAGNRTNV